MQPSEEILVADHSLPGSIYLYFTEVKYAIF